MVRRLTRLPLVGVTATAETADRILNRVWDYPRWLRSRAGDFDLFHIIDHSYAHLALRLPAGRSIVTCHDLDAFRGVLPGSRRRVDRRTGARPAAARRDESGAEDPVRERRHARRAGRRRRSFPPSGSSSCRTACIPRTALDRSRARIEKPRRFSVRRRRSSRAAARRQHDSAQAHRRAAAVSSPLCAGSDPRVRLIQVGGPFTTSQRRLAGRLGSGRPRHGASLRAIGACWRPSIDAPRCCCRPRIAKGSVCRSPRR